eukprot:gb/GECG01010308.1/.p1 GENE.gb/GECG01010308.1/~~gb/GECG01010308.1/.p1  ORF type:complete len:264 (+),score=30.11 gb/GECG01010308.1/:1-792(+)
MKQQGSSYVGVVRDGHKWKAQISYATDGPERRIRNLGRFDTEGEAAQAYDTAAISIRGIAHAKVNFPEDYGLGDGQKARKHARGITSRSTQPEMQPPRTNDSQGVLKKQRTCEVSKDCGGYQSAAKPESTEITLGGDNSTSIGSISPRIAAAAAALVAASDPDVHPGLEPSDHVTYFINSSSGDICSTQVYSRSLSSQAQVCHTESSADSPAVATVPGLQRSSYQGDSVEPHAPSKGVSVLDVYNKCESDGEASPAPVQSWTN